MDPFETKIPTKPRSLRNSGDLDAMRRRLISRCLLVEPDPWARSRTDQPKVAPKHLTRRHDPLASS